MSEQGEPRGELTQETGEPEPDAPGTNDQPRPGLQSVMSWVVVVILSCFGVFMLYKLQHIGEPDQNFWHDKVRDQFPAMVGIPMAALAALFMTLVLRAANGPLEFEALGMKFKGGSGPIVFWIICFLVIITAIKLLWI